MTADRWCWCTCRSSIARALDYANEVSRLRDLATSIRIRSRLQQGSHTSATYFREADSDSRSPHIHIDGDIALEHVTCAVTIWPGDDAPSIEDVGKGVHVYRVSQTDRGSSPT